MKILVTGGTGFTGKALVKRLLNDGHEVVALDYKEGLKTRELREWGAEVIIGSVTDREVVKPINSGRWRLSGALEVHQQIQALQGHLQQP